LPGRNFKHQLGPLIGRKFAPTGGGGGGASGPGLGGTKFGARLRPPPTHRGRRAFLKKLVGFFSGGKKNFGEMLSGAWCFPWGGRWASRIGFSRGPPPRGAQEGIFAGLAQPGRGPKTFSSLFQGGGDAGRREGGARRRPALADVRDPWIFKDPAHNRWRRSPGAPKKRPVHLGGPWPCSRSTLDRALEPTGPAPQSAFPLSKNPTIPLPGPFLVRLFCLGLFPGAGFVKKANRLAAG